MDAKSFADLKPEQLAAAMQLLATNPQYQHVLQHAQAAAASQAQQQHQQQQQQQAQASIPSVSAQLPQYSVPAPPPGGSKYNHLLLIIEELNKDIRPTYAGNRNCAERLKRGLNHAKVLIRECQLELEKLDKQSKAAILASKEHHHNSSTAGPSSSS
uniref:BHLH domain-containing protein n=1 Tax=Panagrellus redivivus TaxID=6233 RepID=A0A7E4V9V8_PANRE